MMKPKAFTVIELLVAIAVMALLSAIAFSIFSGAKKKAQQMTCLNNIAQITKAVLMYADVNDSGIGRGVEPLRTWLDITELPSAASVGRCPGFVHRFEASPVPVGTLHGYAQKDCLSSSRNCCYSPRRERHIHADLSNGP
jgi:prepilin-type N-terminal cleavage/methylation domain-containing protein